MTAEQAKKLLNEWPTDTITLLRRLVDGGPIPDVRHPNAALSDLIREGLAELVRGKDRSIARATWDGRLVTAMWRELAGMR